MINSGIMKNRDIIKAKENFDIEDEKRYLRKDKKPQVEQQTKLVEKKKPKGYGVKK